MANEIANEKVGTNHVVDPSRTRSVLHPIANYGTGINYIRLVKTSGGGSGHSDGFSNGFG